MKTPNCEVMNYKHKPCVVLLRFDTNGKLIKFHHTLDTLTRLH